MLEETGRLTRLVESLLMIARADSGQLQLARADIGVLQLVHEVAAFLEVLIDDKQQELVIDGDESLHTYGDPAILRQVVMNLLDNAIKHTPPGGSISARVAGRDDKMVSIEVEDSGPGIPPAHRDRVFERFYRIDEGRSRDNGGAGLGLAIAKWGAEAHDGRLELQCREAGGCIFRILLPRTGNVLPDGHRLRPKPTPQGNFG
jgi:signal transduction histidine kinase